MTQAQRVDAFLEAAESHAFCVVGASASPSKFGNKCLRIYMANRLKVYPVNAKEDSIEGICNIRSLADLPAGVHGATIVTPPNISEQAVILLAAKGVRHVWFQPGADSPKAIKIAKEHGMAVLSGGVCILVELRAGSQRQVALQQRQLGKL